MNEQRSGWVTFAGVLLMIAGVLNVIWGIAAIADSSFFVEDTRYILSGLNTWGWVALILGILQVFAAFSLWSGGLYGRVFGIGTAGSARSGRCSRSRPIRSGHSRSSRSTSSSSTR